MVPFKFIRMVFFIEKKKQNGNARNRIYIATEITKAKQTRNQRTGNFSPNERNEIANICSYFLFYKQNSCNAFGNWRLKDR